MSEHINQSLPDVSEPLKGRELNGVLELLSKERGLDPQVVDQFLHVDTDKLNEVPKSLKWVIAGTPVLFAVTKGIVATYGDKIPGIVELPPLLHNILSTGFYSLLSQSASSPALRDHIPT